MYLYRVYFLESDVWGQRREELKQTLLYDENAKRMEQKKLLFTFDEHDVLLPKNCLFYTSDAVVVLFVSFSSGPCDSDQSLVSCTLRFHVHTSYTDV